MKKYEFVRVTLSDTRPLFTVQSARRNFLVTGQCRFWSCKFCIVQCTASVYGIKAFQKSTIWVIERIRKMTHNENNFIPEKFSLMTTTKKKNCGPVCDNPVPDIWLSS